MKHIHTFAPTGIPSHNLRLCVRMVNIVTLYYYIYTSVNRCIYLFGLLTRYLKPLGKHTGNEPQFTPG